MRKLNRQIIVAIGDSHGGHIHGMFNPETELWRNGEKVRLPLTDPQQYIWDKVTEHRQKVVELADGDPIIMFHAGDQTQGKKYFSELVSTSESDQMLIAAANLRPWLRIKNLIALHMAVGTSSHVFGEGTSEILVDDVLRREFPKKEIALTYHGLDDIAGLTVDYAHHGPHPGTREWLRGDNARRYLRNSMMFELNDGNAPPHLYLRGHYHSFVEEILCQYRMGVRYKSHLIVLPSYCLLGEYAIQATQSEYKSTIGLVAVEVINGQIFDTHLFESSLDTRTKRKIL